MNYKELEKSMQQKVHEHEVKMDTHQLVADLFGNKRRRRPIALWLIAIAAFLLAAAGGYYFFMNREVHESILPEDIELNDQKALLESSNSTDASSAMVQDYDNSNVTSNINNMSSSASMQAQYVNGSIPSDQNAFSSAKLNGNGKSIFSGMNRNNSKDVVYNYSVSKIIKEKNNQTPQDPNTNSNKAKYPEKSAPISELSPTSQPVVFIQPADEVDQIKLPGVKCPSFKKKKPLTLSIIPEIGYFYPLTTFSNSSPISSEVLDIRKLNETTLEGLQAAVYGKVGWKSIPWYFKSGLNYGRITRRMDLDQSFIRKDTTIGIISITESQNGDTLTVIRGPIITDTHVTRKEIRHYYHHLWSIPLVIGYQKHYDDFEWAVEAGINFNMSTSQSGFVMTTPDEFGLVRNAGLYKNKVGVSYLAQIQIGRPINEHNILAFALRANFNPNNFAKNASSIDEKYQMIGAHLMYELRF